MTVPDRVGRPELRSSTRSAVKIQKTTPPCCHNPRPTVVYNPDEMARRPVATIAAGVDPRQQAAMKKSPSENDATKAAVIFSSLRCTKHRSRSAPQRRAMLVTGTANDTIPEGNAE